MTKLRQEILALAWRLEANSNATAILEEATSLMTDEQLTKLLVAVKSLFSLGSTDDNY